NDGQSWQYDQAEIGQTYNVQVALQVNEGNVGTANMLTAVAPASNLNFTVNTGLSLAAPNSQAIPEPCQRDGDKWKTTIKIPWVSGAGQYWIQVGSKENYADIYNQKISANGENDVTIELKGFQLGVMNHVRYSYSKCRSCGSSQNFSAWSQDKTFTCE
ncbi:MAG: hypothetical protein Q4G02_01045, partial [bacterium]|nr:hypothetical protein [bacterium]